MNKTAKEGLTELAKQLLEWLAIFIFTVLYIWMATLEPMVCLMFIIAALAILHPIVQANEPDDKP